MPPDRPPHDAVQQIFGVLLGGPSGWLTVGLTLKWRALAAGRWGDDALEMIVAFPLILGVIAGLIGSSLAQAFARRQLAGWRPIFTSLGGAWAGGAAAAALVVALTGG